MALRILVIGAEGMAGHMISSYLKENSNDEIIPWGLKDFEVLDNGEWKEKIERLNALKPVDYIVNCIGILKVANNNPVLGIKINSLFPHELAQLCSSLRIKIIHLSTDCYNDLDVYGRSKRAGELDYPNHLTIRTSIIGPELNKNGAGLFHWFMSSKDLVYGFTEHYWDGVTTLELSKRILHIIQEQPTLGGIKELRTNNRISKFSLLELINSIFNKGIKVLPKPTPLIDKTNENPDISCNIDFKEQLKELKFWMLNHPYLYGLYSFY